MSSLGISHFYDSLSIVAGAAGGREVCDVVAPAKAERDDVIDDGCGGDVTESAAIAAQWFIAEDGEALAAVGSGSVPKRRTAAVFHCFD